MTQLNQESIIYSAMPELTSNPVSRQEWPKNIKTLLGLVNAGVFSERLLPWLLPISILLLWQFASYFVWVSPQVLPAPCIVFSTLWRLITDGSIFEHAFISLSRVLLGGLLGGITGLLIGLAMGLSRHVNDIVGPTIRALALVPKLGWIPLLTILVGIDEALKVVSIAIGAAVPVVMNTYTGIARVPERYLEAATVLKITGLKRVKTVIFPAALPNIITGFVLAFSFSWKALIAVELMASSEGLGFLMTWGRQLFQMDIVLSAVIVIGLIGFILDKALVLTSNKVLAWLR